MTVAPVLAAAAAADRGGGPCVAVVAARRVQHLVRAPVVVGAAVYLTTTIVWKVTVPSVATRHLLPPRDHNYG